MTAVTKLVALGPLAGVENMRICRFLRALSNVFLSLRSLRERPRVENMLFFACFEQCFPILEATPGTSQSREYVVFCML